MGAGCSSSAAATAQLPHKPDCPPRPTYQACDLVGPPVLEKIRIGPVDAMLFQATQFAEAVCELNDSLNGLLLDVRLATGLLQGGFTLALSPSANVDIFSFELLTAEGRPLEVAEVARLRGHDTALHGGRLAALDAQLARSLEGLADFFVRNVGASAASASPLVLSPAGTLVPRAAAAASVTSVSTSAASGRGRSGNSNRGDAAAAGVNPVVAHFNEAMTDMRSALGADYMLALHLHKAQAHGMPVFRVRLLKSAPEPQQEHHEHHQQQQQQLPPGVRALAEPSPFAAASGAVAAAAGSGTHLTLSTAATAAPPLLAAPSGLQPATLLDQAACLNASQLVDALHAFQDANGRLAAALEGAGLTSRNVVIPVTARSVALAGTTAAADTSTTSTSATSATNLKSSLSVSRLPQRHSVYSQRGRKSSSAVAPTPAANNASVKAAAAAADVRSLPAASRRAVSRAVDGLNAAVHGLAHAAAAAPGPASFAALLTHVLGELRDVVAAAGGERALDSYQPTVHFVGGPDEAPSLDFQFDPRLPGGTAAPAARTGSAPSGPLDCSKWARAPLPFPDCLSPQVRRAWLLLQELFRVHNRVVGQLRPLGELAAAFEEGLRRRGESLSQDAATARMSGAEAAEAGRALLRNHVELRDCWQGALHVLAATARLVRDELAEAAQLARVQCSVMSPLAWSLSLASSPSVTATPPPGASSATSSAACSAAPTGSLTSALALSTATSATGPLGGASRRSLTAGGGGGGGTSIRSRGSGGAARSLASLFEAVAAEDPKLTPMSVGPSTPPDESREPSRHNSRQLQPQLSYKSTSAAASSATGSWPPLAAAGGVEGSCGGRSPAWVVSSAQSQTAAEPSSFPPEAALRSTAAAAARTGSRTGRRDTMGWVPVDACANSAPGMTRGSGGRPVGQAEAPPQLMPHSSTAAQQLAAAAPAATLARGRAGAGESLAEEYARAALAHLQMRGL